MLHTARYREMSRDRTSGGVSSRRLMTRSRSVADGASDADACAVQPHRKSFASRTLNKSSEDGARTCESICRTSRSASSCLPSPPRWPASDSHLDFAAAELIAAAVPVPAMAVPPVLRGKHARSRAHCLSLSTAVTSARARTSAATHAPLGRCAAAISAVRPLESTASTSAAFSSAALALALALACSTIASTALSLPYAAASMSALRPCTSAPAASAPCLSSARSNGAGEAATAAAASGDKPLWALRPSMCALAAISAATQPS
eukprot:381223-Pleurochrysis_carterae.AAC.1